MKREESSFSLAQIGIAGLGVVGSAVCLGFEKRAVSVQVYDKYKKVGEFKDLLDCRIVFLCLPTLFSVELGEFDKSAIVRLCEKLAKHRYSGLVVLKSTVEPGTMETLSRSFSVLNFAFNPEFLSARTAREDFDSQKHVVLGKVKGGDETLFEALHQLYKVHWPDANISVCLAAEAECMKLFANSFYAMKVQAFNEFYLLCQKMDVDYNRVRELMLGNGWINSMHTVVPGPDGELGFGGACLPKDSCACMHLMKKHNSPNLVISAAVEECERVRSNKKI